MEKDDIERLIRRYFRQNYFADPSLFPDIVVKSIVVYRATAQGYWDHRTTDEVKRDRLAGITLDDYYEWVGNELLRLKITDAEKN